MNQIHEIDLEDRTVTVQPGINMLKLNEELRPLRLHLSRRPGVVPVLARRRPHRHQRLVADRRALRAHARPRHLLRGRAADRRDHPGRRGRRQEGSQVLHRLPAQAALHGPPGHARHRHRGDARAGPAPGGRVLRVLRLSQLHDAWRATGELARSGVATLAGVVLFDEWKVAYLRRDDEAYIPQPDWVKAVVAVAMYGNADEVRVGAKRLLRIGAASGGTYLGDEISQGDWASRHDRYATPLHGRTPNGQVVPMSWHCEDAAINYSKLPEVREKWHAIVAGLRERFDIFDDWGMFAYTNGAYKPWGDYLTEIDVGIWEQEWDDESWAAWVDAKREIARVAIEHGGSITACHGSCREGEVDLVPLELGGGFDVMKKIKRALDPNNVMNPGKYLLDQAYEEED